MFSHSTSCDNKNQYELAGINKKLSQRGVEGKNCVIGFGRHTRLPENSRPLYSFSPTRRPCKNEAVQGLANEKENKKSRRGIRRQRSVALCSAACSRSIQILWQKIVALLNISLRNRKAQANASAHEKKPVRGKRKAAWMQWILCGSRKKGREWGMKSYFVCRVFMYFWGIEWILRVNKSSVIYATFLHNEKGMNEI